MVSRPQLGALPLAGCSKELIMHQGFPSVWEGGRLAAQDGRWFSVEVEILLSGTGLLVARSTHVAAHHVRGTVRMHPTYIAASYVHVHPNLQSCPSFSLCLFVPSKNKVSSFFGVPRSRNAASHPYVFPRPRNIC